MWISWMNSCIFLMYRVISGVRDEVLTYVIRVAEAYDGMIKSCLFKMLLKKLKSEQKVFVIGGMLPKCVK